MKFILAPFALAFALNLFVANPSYRVFGLFTDHLSHMMTIFLFWDHGLDIYRKPVEELCPIRSSHQIDAFNENWNIPEIDRINTCQVREGGRVLFLNWPHVARPYPIGDLLWFGPAAGLYAMTGTLSGVGQFLFWQLLLTFGIGMYLCAKYELFKSGERSFEKSVWVLFSSIALASSASMGFYDGLSFLILVAAILVFFRRDERSDGTALVLWSLAFLFHYRVIWYFPLPLIMVLRRGAWVDAKLVAALGLASISIFTLALSLPSVRSLTPSNPFLLKPFSAYASIILVGGICAFLSYSDRNWAVLSCIFSATFFTATTPLAQMWYLLFWMPLPLLALIGSRRPRLFWACFALVLALDQNIYGFSLLSGGAFPEMLRQTVLVFQN